MITLTMPPARKTKHHPARIACIVQRAHRRPLALVLALAILLTSCASATVSTNTPALKNTPIVVDIIIPPGAKAIVSTPKPAEATPRRAYQVELPSVSIAATSAIAQNPQAAVNRTVLLDPLPTDASTGLTPTNVLTDTALPGPLQEIQLPSGTINIALLGVDSRPDRGFANTDVIMIASINPDVPAVTLLSIPRDTLVYIPGWRSAKANMAYAHGGPELFKQMIKYNFGINVDYYAMVNFSGVVDAVDTLGGVDIVATCPLYQVFPKDPYYMADETSPMTVTQVYTDNFTGEVWKPGTAVPTATIAINRPGVYTLNGIEALAFVRARYGVPGGDVDRGRREQRLIRALLVKVKQLNAITRVPQLYAQFTQDIKTDLNLENILYFAGMANRFSDAVIRSRYIDAAGLTAATFPEIGSVLIPDREKLHDYIQQSLYVALNQRPNEGIPIEVWNGTGDRDFGIVAADRLAELGFLIADVRPSPQPAARTTIIDYTTTRKGSAIPLLQRTFKLADDRIVAQPAKEGPRYRVIVGPDFDPCYYDNGGSVPIQIPTSAQP